MLTPIAPNTTCVIMWWRDVTYDVGVSDDSGGGGGGLKDVPPLQPTLPQNRTHREVVVMRVVYVLELDERRLARDLRGHLVVGEAGGGEDGDLLPARHGVHHVDGRDAWVLFVCGEGRG